MDKRTNRKIDPRPANRRPEPRRCHRWVTDEKNEKGQVCSQCPAICRRDSFGKIIDFDAYGQLPPNERPDAQEERR